VKLSHLFVIGAIVASTGCASGLNSYQKSELRHFEAAGLAVEEKNPAMGTALGLLPVAAPSMAASMAWASSICCSGRSRSCGIRSAATALPRPSTITRPNST